MSNLDHAIIGNCSFAALVDQNARIVWACMPHFDDDPVFCAMLNGRNGEEGGSPWGFWDIELLDQVAAEQRYMHNSAVLVTRLEDKHDCAIEIVDFAPRFVHHGRYFRPLSIVRMIRPIRGEPRIRVRLRPRFHYGAVAPQITRGSNHLRFVSTDQVLRLTTDAPISYIHEEVAFTLEEPVTMFFGADESLTAPVAETGRNFLEATERYWRDYARYLALPFEWQQDVIRAAITLKLCTFEETGAVLAAVTTSIPEFSESERNWDYRYCWLRDAYFVIHTLNRLGATKTMEDYLRYIINIVSNAPNGTLQPVYGITLSEKLYERDVETLSGYRGMGPVRVGNLAYEQVQNDIYGAVILAAAQVFFDTRLVHTGGVDLFNRLERLGDKAVELFDKPDAGLWELREEARTHTFSSVMCWAACDRLAKIARHLGLEERARYWREHADYIHSVVYEKTWCPAKNSFADAWGGDEIDASLLLLHELGFCEADDPRFIGTVDAVSRELRVGPYVFRYLREDDFGKPEATFNICTFWYICALSAIGRQDEAREMFENMLAQRNHVGLLSEDICPQTGDLWGNFPQTYSMVGLITSAMRLSRNWEDVF